MNVITQQLSVDLASFLASAKRPLIVVLGPTASGKTDFSVRLAQHLNALPTNAKQGRGAAEIVNADSRQLYRALDIGTAKITGEEMQGVPHHLLDIADPKEEVTAAQYQKLAMTEIDAILGKNGLPLLVGGSMLYLSAVIDGLGFVAPSNPAIRAQLSADYDQDGGKSLHKRLTEIDASAAANIPRANKHYLLRALELHTITGRKPSDAQTAKSDCPYDLFVIGMELPPDVLAERIEKRTKQMIAAGWIDEVQSLLHKGYGPTDPAMKSHGYREIMDYLESGKTDTDALTTAIVTKSRQYAKRQRTWWRGDERIRWVAPDTQLG